MELAALLGSKAYIELWKPLGKRISSAVIVAIPLGSNTTVAFVQVISGIGAIISMAISAFRFSPQEFVYS